MDGRERENIGQIIFSFCRKNKNNLAKDSLSVVSGASGAMSEDHVCTVFKEACSSIMKNLCRKETYRKALEMIHLSSSTSPGK